MSDQAQALVMDKTGDVYVAGTTNSADFPTTSGAYDRIYGSGTCNDFMSSEPCRDIFVTKLAIGDGVVVPPNILITEVDVSEPDWIELYNIGSQSVNLTGWQLRIYAPNGTTHQIYTIPAFTLQSGAYVVLHEEAGSNTATDLYFNAAITEWLSDGSGAATLKTGNGTTVDFVRWGSSTVSSLAESGWSGTNPAGPPVGKSLGRDSENSDTDSGDDWTAQDPSPGAQNVGSGTSIYLPVIMK